MFQERVVTVYAAARIMRASLSQALSVRVMPYCTHLQETVALSSMSIGAVIDLVPCFNLANVVPHGKHHFG